MKQLKPITFKSVNASSKYRQNIIQQNLVLKALPHTTDLEELRKVANLHSKAEVLRTLDKLAIRRDFHDALVNNGLNMDFLVKGLKEICETADKDETRLHGLQTVLKSVGMDKYETSETDGKDWEGLLLKINEQERQGQIEDKKSGAIDAKYEVVFPDVPESAKKIREEDDEIGKSIYE